MPSAFKTCFDSVLNGEVWSKVGQSLTHVCCVALKDGALKRFWKLEDHNLQQPAISPNKKAVVNHFERSHINHEEGRFTILLEQKGASLYSVTQGPKHSECLKHWSDHCKWRGPSMSWVKSSGKTLKWATHNWYGRWK